MNRFYHIFKNSGDSEYNDLVYNPSDTLHLEDSRFDIVLTPLSGTKYWRFGIALSQQEHFGFEPSAGRYSNQNLRFIEIDVGERSQTGWGYPSRIALGSYYFPQMESPMLRYDTYISQSEVHLKITLNTADNKIDIQLKAPGCPALAAQLPVDGYKFVKFFAWADYVPYALGCFLQVSAQGDEDSFEIYPEPAAGDNYWIFRLPKTKGKQSDAEARSEVTEVVHTFQSANADKAVDTPFLEILKKGDKLFAYDDEHKVVLYLLEVGNITAGADVTVRMKVLEYYRPNIQASSLLRHFIYGRLLQPESAYYLVPMYKVNFEEFIKLDYDFPTVALSDNERKYLEIMYQNWLHGREITSSYSLQELWKDFPRDFEPAQINSLLLTGREISLWGISQIHPESPIFEKFDRVIWVIRRLLSQGKIYTQISIRLILDETGDALTDHDVLRIFKLMLHFPNLIRSFGTAPDGTRTIELGEDRFYETYREYEGLWLFMRKFLSSHGVRYARQSGEATEEGRMTYREGLYRTPFPSLNRSNFTPVMGVKLLAFDIAKIIQELPNEKGQMIGIFGKWGRGKTFFIKQLWNVLLENKETIFIRVSYDAWKYQETPASWAYLYERLAEGYLGKFTWKFWRPYPWRLLRLNLKRNGPWPVLIFASATVAILSTWTFSRWKPFLITVIPASILLLAGLLIKLWKENSAKAVNLIKKYTIRHHYRGAMGMQASIQEELIKLLEVWIPGSKIGKQKIILEVEDIDRCRQDKIIETIDGLRTMLEDDAVADRLIILTAIDENILKSAISTKYSSFFPSKREPADELALQELVIEQLDKLFVSAIKLGVLTPYQRVEFVDTILQYRKSAKVPASSAEPPVVPEESSGSAQTGKQPTGQAPEVPLEGQKPEASAAREQAPGDTLSSDLADSWQEVSDLEGEYLRDVVRSWEKATPRKVWIFYHRYLLCKNLLIGKLLAEGRTSFWQTQQGARKLMLLLKYFGDLHDPDKIKEQEQSLLSSSVATVSINYIPATNAFTISHGDYLLLLQTLEMVIAY